MLIGLIMAIIFGGGAESEFVSSIPNLQKEIRQHVIDDARKDSLLILVKDYEKAIKKYEKEENQYKKKLNKTSADRGKSTEEFLAVWDNYNQARLGLLSSLIDYRLLFQNQITEEELLLVIENAYISSKKERRQDEKEEEKAEEKLDKVFRDIEEIVGRHVEDSAKTAIINNHLYVFESAIYAYVDEAAELLVEKKIKLDDKHATRDEIIEMYERSNQLRYKASRDFAIVRAEVIRNTDENEWKAINKEFDLFLKN